MLSCETALTEVM